MERRKDEKGETIVTRLERRHVSSGRSQKKRGSKRTHKKPKVETLEVKLVLPKGKKGHITKNGKRVNLQRRPYKGLSLKKAYQKILKNCQEKGFDKC